MAGLLDWLGIGDPSQPATAGILGNQAPPQQQGWQSGVGLLGATLRDIGANFSGRPEDANNIAQYGQLQRQMQMRQAAQTAIAGTQSSDPATRQQAYTSLAYLDPTALDPLMKMQAQKGWGDLASAMANPGAPSSMPGALAAAPSAPGAPMAPGATPGTAPTPQAQPAPSTSALPQNVMAVLQANPSLASSVMPTLLNRQLNQAVKLSPQDVAQNGFPVGANVYRMPDGTLQSDLKSSAQVKQANDITASAPETQYQKSQLALQSQQINRPIAMPLGTTLVSPQTGQPVGGSGAMGMPVTAGKLSNNINDYPPQMQGVIRGMLSGTIAPPQGSALRAPQTMQLVEAAAAIDPSFDETKWSARNKMAGDSMGNGAWGKSMNALGTATQHVAALGNYAGGTASTTLPRLNQVLNWGDSALGGAGPTVYQDTAHKVGEEYTRAYRGAGGSETDIKSSMDALSPDASATTKNAVIDENMNLARDKMAENVQQYNRTMGTNKQISDFVSPQTAAAYAARGIDINTGNKIAPGGAQGQNAPAPSPQNLPRTAAAPVRINSDSDYNNLSSGTVFVGPDGKQRRKP